MKLSSHLARRVAAATAVAGAAILIPAVALAAPGRAAAPQASAPGCTASQVQPWLGLPGSGTAGSTFYQLEISNVSKSTCTLRGFPGVSAQAADGRQFGSPAGRDFSGPVRLVTLAPGATSHVELQVTDVGVFSPAQCGQTISQSLRVFAPGDFRSHEIGGASFQVCSKAGPVYLHVSPVAAGTGIPLFTN
jgi:hypothetical protein